MVAIVSLLISVNAMSSASIEDVVTVGCLDILQAIGVLYKVII